MFSDMSEILHACFSQLTKKKRRLFVFISKRSYLRSGRKKPNTFYYLVSLMRYRTDNNAGGRS